MAKTFVLLVQARPAQSSSKCDLTKPLTAVKVNYFLQVTKAKSLAPLYVGKR